MMIFRDQYCILNALTSTYLVTYTHQMKCTQKRVRTCACPQCQHLIEYICLRGLGLHRLFPFVLILPMYYLIVVFANTRRSLMQCWHRLFNYMHLFLKCFYKKCCGLSDAQARKTNTLKKPQKQKKQEDHQLLHG